MNKLATVLALSLVGLNAYALPKLGFYKDLYSASKGIYSCSQVISNTKKVTIAGRKVTYFEFTNGGGTKFTCIPQVFVDTDGTNADGDPERFIFTSLSTAFCTVEDGNVSMEVSFDSSHIFWSGESYGPVTLPDSVIPALVKQKEKQTSYGKFFSTTSCP